MVFVRSWRPCPVNAAVHPIKCGRGRPQPCHNQSVFDTWRVVRAWPSANNLQDFRVGNLQRYGEVICSVELLTDDDMQQTNMFMQKIAEISRRSSLKKKILICQYKDVCVRKWERERGFSEKFKIFASGKISAFTHGPRYGNKIGILAVIRQRV